MSKNEGENKAKSEQKPIPKAEQKSQSTELTDKDLEKVSGGAALTYGREKLKGTSQTTGDFNLDSRPLEPRPPPPPAILKIV